MFITYAALGTSLMIYPLSIIDTDKVKKWDKMIIDIVFVKNFIISIILIIFTIWNWFLTLQGITVIEFMQNREDFPQDDYQF